MTDTLSVPAATSPGSEPNAPRRRTEPPAVRTAEPSGAPQVVLDRVDAASVDLMAPEQNVQRIMRTGTVWFATALASIALALGPLLASGWRPAVLPLPLEAVWWLGSLAVAGSLGLIGWSGCPILEVSVPTADRNKTRTMQIGTASLIIGVILCLFAVMAGPAA